MQAPAHILSNGLGSSSWGNCDVRGVGHHRDKSVTLEHDPINTLGTLTVSVEVKTNVLFDDPQKVGLPVKEVAGFWVKILCVKQIGSCIYDICDILGSLILPAQNPHTPVGFPATIPSKKGPIQGPGLISSCPTWICPAGLAPGGSGPRAS
ncbi:ganglioside GM2 activator-like [Vicugna pacos]|uniref:Ganglioside GM2 activator-like n=1 Tax=Vicugna pacos TaxID=30538 RepID=A0ABM5CXW6_VICPA